MERWGVELNSPVVLVMEGRGGEGGVELNQIPANYTHLTLSQGWASDEAATTVRLWHHNIWEWPSSPLHSPLTYGVQ